MATSGGCQVETVGVQADLEDRKRWTRQDQETEDHKPPAKLGQLHICFRDANLTNVTALV
jgi:hypothetical protein